MVINIPLNTMVDNGHSDTPQGNPWNTMVLYDIPSLLNHVMLNGTIIYNHGHQYIWLTIEYHGWQWSLIPMVTHEIPWLTMRYHVFSLPVMIWLNTMVEHCWPWFTMNDHGCLWWIHTKFQLDNLKISVRHTL